VSYGWRGVHKEFSQYKKKKGANINNTQIIELHKLIPIIQILINKEFKKCYMRKADVDRHYLTAVLHVFSDSVNSAQFLLSICH